jgi:hypothetical protein
MRLVGRATVVEGWASERHPDRGTIRLVGELRDEQGNQVMSMQARGHARRRKEEEG